MLQILYIMIKYFDLLFAKILPSDLAIIGVLQIEYSQHRRLIAI